MKRLEKLFLILVVVYAFDYFPSYHYTTKYSYLLTEDNLVLRFIFQQHPIIVIFWYIVNLVGAYVVAGWIKKYSYRVARKFFKQTHYRASLAAEYASLAFIIFLIIAEILIVCRNFLLLHSYRLLQL